jgi:hypothetical protein
MDAVIDISDVIQQSMVGYLGIVLPGGNTQLKPITRECVQSGYHVE